MYPPAPLSSPAPLLPPRSARHPQAPPSAAEEAAMLSGGKANVPITPDVAYTGKG